MSVVKVFAGNPLGEDAKSARYLGSAFLISDRWLLTCWHVVKDVPPENLYLMGIAFGSGVARIQGNVVQHPNRDIAAMQLTAPVGAKVAVLQSDDSQSLSKGTQLTLRGCTRADLDIEEPTACVSVYDSALDLHHTDKPVGKGMSGGPALHEGRVVGVTQAKDDARTLIIPVRAFREFAKQQVGNAVPDNGGLDKKHRDGIRKLKTAVTKILDSKEMRRFVLLKNGLPANLSAADLTDRMFAVTPQFRDADENHSPMCFLYKCTIPPAPDEKDRKTICELLDRIAALVAPVSFMVDDTSEIVSMIDKAADSAAIASKHGTVAASLVATFLGLPVDVEHREIIERNNGFECSGDQVERGAVYSASLVPIKGIEEQDIVDVVARGLAPLIGSLDPEPTNVMVQLRLLAGKPTSCVCLWFNGELHPTETKKLKEAFPDLFILTSKRKAESRINALVMTQLQEIKTFIKDSQ